MNLLNTEFGRFLWRVFIIIIFLGIMFLIIKSAMASWKRTGKWCPKDGSSRNASKPLPENCRSAARQPAGN